MEIFSNWLNENLDQNLMKQMTDYLSKIEKAGFRLIAHQTSDDVALNIVKGQDFSDRGLDGTALFQNSDQITQTIQKMNALHSKDQQAYQQIGGVPIHKGSNAIVIMVIPTKLPVRGMRDLDDYLVDLVSDGKIKGFGLPNQYIVGFWKWDGQFFGNSRFNPKGLL